MRIPFDQLFSVDQHGNCKAKHAYKLVVAKNTLAGKTGESMAFGLFRIDGFDVGQFIGADLEVVDESGVYNIVGFYPTDD